MAKKSAKPSASVSSPTKAPEVPSVTVPVVAVQNRGPLPIVTVNNSNLVELKHAADDAVKFYFGRPTAYTQSHKYEDVRLILGWSSSIIGLGSAYYGYTNDFQASKTIVAIGVIAYWILSGALAYFTFFVEKSTVFQGKRKTVASRISTEVIVISTRANFSPPRQHSFLSLFSLSYADLLTPFLPTPPFSKPLGPFPSYSIHLEYVHSSNGGKVLIKKGEARTERCFGDFFDTQGKLGRAELEEALHALEDEAMRS